MSDKDSVPNYSEVTQVFCPMCEVEHEATTWCQADFNGMEG